MYAVRVRSYLAISVAELMPYLGVDYRSSALGSVVWVSTCPCSRFQFRIVPLSSGVTFTWTSPSRRLAHRYWVDWFRRLRRDPRCVNRSRNDGGLRYLDHGRVTYAGSPGSGLCRTNSLYHSGRRPYLRICRGRNLHLDASLIWVPSWTMKVAVPFPSSVE